MIVDAAAAQLVDDVADALRDAGLRVADTFGDITPPSFYIGLEGATSEGATLADPVVATFALWWIPVRGLGNTRADVAALLAGIAALAPLTLEAIDFRVATLTVDPTAPWIAWRAYLTT